MKAAPAAAVPSVLLDTAATPCSPVGMSFGGANDDLSIATHPHDSIIFLGLTINPARPVFPEHKQLCSNHQSYCSSDRQHPSIPRGNNDNGHESSNCAWISASTSNPLSSHKAPPSSKASSLWHDVHCAKALCRPLSPIKRTSNSSNTTRMLILTVFSAERGL